MNELERENKRLRAVVEELATVVDRMREFVIATVGLENFTLLENNAELEKENAELRQKAEAWELFEKVKGRGEVIFSRTEKGWSVWSLSYIGFYTGNTPFEAFMNAYNAMNKDEDDHEMR